MSSTDAFRGSYSPGGLGPKTRKRQLAKYNGRMGGLASGVVRRQLAKGKRCTRDGGLGVPKAYRPEPWLSPEKVEHLFRSQCEAEGRRFHQAGADTFYAVYAVLKRWQIAKGQDFEITNENVSRALETLQRPHSRRTVQYTRLRLVRSGVLRCSHVKRSGARRVPGQMDTIRVRILRSPSKHCTPPLRGTAKRDFVPELGCGSPEVEKEMGPETALSPPAPPADDQAAIAANNGSNDEEGYAAFQARLRDLCARARPVQGLSAPRGRAREVADRLDGHLGSQRPDEQELRGGVGPQRAHDDVQQDDGRPADGRGARPAAGDVGRDAVDGPQPNRYSVGRLLAAQQRAAELAAAPDVVDLAAYRRRRDR